MKRTLPCGLVLCLSCLLPSCASEPGPAVGEIPVPGPVNLMLPKAIRIHPFTGLKAFEGGGKGVDVRIEAVDAYGDATKAYGDFRFELFSYKAFNPDPRDRKLANWDVSVMSPRQNMMHWDTITRAYEFKLEWDEAVARGEKLVLVVTYSSPFSERLFAQRVFVAGQ